MAAHPAEVASPLTVVDALFAQAQAAAGTGSVGDAWGEKEHFVRALGLDDEENFANVPCLNDVELAESVSPFSLVRYRCLVQDVFELEIFEARLLDEPDGVESTDPKRIITSKYRECIPPAAGRKFTDAGREALSQRGVCYCVPLPGETRWARDAAKALTRAQPQKAPGAPNVPPPPQPAVQKRRRPDEDVEMGDEEQSSKPRSEEALSAGTRRPPRASAAQRDQPLQNAEDFGLNFPLPEEEQRGRGYSTPCLVKTYGADADSLRVCEVVEVLGVLCVNPELASFDGQAIGEDDFARDARSPSTALVPRLHAIMVRRLPFYHPLFPYTPDWLSEARLATAFQKRFVGGQAAVDAVRGATLAMLAPSLSGDMLAAEYVLMQLVSRAFGKQGDQALGSWCLNVLDWPVGASVRALSDAAAELVPRAVYLEMSTSSLQTQRWRPSKDFIANRLVAARLQLAPGSLLTIDETGICAGELSADGVRNISAVSELTTGHQLLCDFSSYDVRIPLEVSSILVSQGRSMIKNIDAAVPLRPCSASASPAAPTVEAMEAARFFIGLVTRQPKPLQIPDEVTHRVGEDFAAVRQEFAVPSELCHTWLSLARAQCLLHGESALTTERWRATLEFERERLRRCKERGLFQSQ